MASVTVPDPTRIGPVESWSVTDPATPNAPGDSSGNTGATNVTVRAGIDPEFVINDDYTFTSDEGSVTGVITNVVVAGATDETATTASLTGTTALDLLNTERGVRPLTLGSPRTTVYESLLAVGVANLTGTAINNGTYYPLLGSTSGYSGAYSNPAIHGDLFQHFSIPDGLSGDTTLTTISGTDSGLTVTGYASDNGIAQGRLNIGASVGEGINLQYLVSSADVRISYIGSAGYQPPSYADVMFWTLNTTTNAYSVGIVDSGTTSGTYTVNDSQPLVVNILVSGASITISLTDFTGTTQTLTRARASGTFANQPIYLGEFSNSANSGSGSISIVGAKVYTGSSANNVYWTAESITGLTYTATDNTPNYPIPGYTGNVWDHIKQVCSGFGVEFWTTGGGYGIRDIGDRVLSLDNVEAGSASLTLNNRAAGRSVDFVNYKTTAGYGTLYDSFDANSILSVDAGETTTLTVTTNNYPSSVEQPRRITDLSVISAGTYYVSGEDNLPVVADQWEAYGASVSVTVNEANASSLDITLVGPREEIPGVPGPYYFGASDGSTRYPIFSVQGAGVFSERETVNILSGADHSKVTTEVAFTVDNYTLVDKDRVYARCTWALTTASGPIVSLSVTVPTSATDGFGLTGGALVSFKENQYRITEAVIDKMTTGLTAERHLTVGEFDTFSTGATVGDFDTFWTGNACEDLKIRPLRVV